MDESNIDPIMIKNENNRYSNKELDKSIQNNNQKTNNSTNFSNKYKIFVKNNVQMLKSHLYNKNSESNSKTSILTEKRKETIDSFNTNSNINFPLINKYYAKVTVENIRQPKDILMIFDNFVEENDYEKICEINQEKGKLTFLFYKEEIAFEFSKVLNSHKAKNSLYNDMSVNLTLTPNNNYNKNNLGTIKKRGISHDTIQRLFQGLGGRKKIKKDIKSLKVLINSPFYSNDNKQRNNNKNMENKSMMKDYNKYDKYHLRVLDTDYTGLRIYNFRDVAKDRWISPSNFFI